MQAKRTAETLARKRLPDREVQRLMKPYDIRTLGLNMERLVRAKECPLVRLSVFTFHQHAAHQQDVLAHGVLPLEGRAVHLCPAALDIAPMMQAFAMWARIKPRLQEQGRCYQALVGLEMPLTPVLAGMEALGIAVDLTHLQQQLVSLPGKC